MPYVILESNEILDVGTNMTVIGFGDAFPGPVAVYPTFLQEAELNYVSSLTCNETYGGVGGISDDMMCASAPGRDTW